jgi:outer membrane protein/protease secretion system outer membrane protein
MTVCAQCPGGRRWFACVAGVLLASPYTVGAADLLGAYRRALENDANFLAARANTDAAREAVPQARAGLLPTLSLSASRSKNNSEITQNSVLGPRSSHFDYIAEGQNLTLRQPLYRRANLAQFRQAEAQVAGAELTLDKERQNVAARVTGAYFDALAAQDQMRFAAEQKKAYYAQWQRAVAMLDKGAGTRTDRDETRARYDGVLAQEIDAANALDLAERTLAFITGRPVAAGALAPLDERRLPLEAPAPASFDEWAALAEHSNPELAALRYGIEVNRQEVSKQRSGHLPTLDLIAQRSYSASETVSIIGSQYNTDLVGVQVSIPLYSGGAVMSAERQALAGLERARQQYEAVKRQVTLSLRREYNNVMLGIAKVRALEQAVQSAGLALASTEMGVRAGTRNTLDVLNARQQVFRVRRDLGKGRYDYVVARLRLKAAAGTLGEGDIELVNRWLTSAK